MLAPKKTLTYSGQQEPVNHPEHDAIPVKPHAEFQWNDTASL
ncbi:hypothetical protein [Giesbergeria sp.]|nr:hypothetical protein [Giesbergeria sp.]